MVPEGWFGEFRLLGFKFRTLRVVLFMISCMHFHNNSCVLREARWVSLDHPVRSHALYIFFISVEHVLRPGCYFLYYIFFLFLYLNPFYREM